MSFRCFEKSKRSNATMGAKGSVLPGFAPWGPHCRRYHQTHFANPKQRVTNMVQKMINMQDWMLMYRTHSPFCSLCCTVRRGILSSEALRFRIMGWPTNTPQIGYFFEVRLAQITSQSSRLAAQLPTLMGFQIQNFWLAPESSKQWASLFFLSVWLQDFAAAYVFVSSNQLFRKLTDCI